MSMSGEFVDTNVLLYAHDSSAGRKRMHAVALLERLSADRSGLLSTQVLMEFYVVATRKLARKLDKATASAIVEDFGTWPVFSPAVADILAAARVAERHELHFWDGMIVHAAITLDAAVLWSEDLNAGQRYDGVVVKNPFV
jgi:predicted nucleic acid-binding protein